MYSECKCINLTFVCSDEVTTFNFNMTNVGLLNGNPYYLGIYDGETYIIYKDGSSWIFANNNNPNVYIFYAISSATQACSISPGDWVPDNLTEFDYCVGGFDTSPIVIDEIIDEYPNCGLFSGNCECNTIEFVEGSKNCNLVFQTCEGRVVNLSLNSISGLSGCFSGTPIFVNTDGIGDCGNIIVNNDVSCDKYCTTKTLCCINITAETETTITTLENLEPIGIINGNPFYVFYDALGNTFILYYVTNGINSSWVIVNSVNTQPVANLDITDECPIGEWDVAVLEPYYLFVKTELGECPNTPEPIPPCLTGQTVNECDVITILPLGVECQITNPTYTTTQDGEITLLVTGGTPPYQIFWKDGNVGITIDNLTAGTYTATVVDYYGDFSATTSCVLTANPPPIPCKNPIIQILDGIKNDFGLNTQDGVNELYQILTSTVPTQVNNCEKAGNCSPNCQPYMLMNLDKSQQLVSMFESYCYNFNCCVSFLGDYNTFNEWQSTVDSPIFEDTTFQIDCTPGSPPYCEGSDIVEETNCDEFSDIQDCLNDLGTILPSGSVDDLLENGIFESGLFSGSSLLCLLKEYFEENSITSSFALQYINTILNNGMVIVYGTEPEDECIATIFGTDQYLTTISEISTYCELCVCYTPNGITASSEKYDLLGYEINGKPAWSSQTNNTLISWNNTTSVWEITPASYYLGTSGQIINSTTINNTPDGTSWTPLGGPPLFSIVTTYQIGGGYIESCNGICAKALGIRF